MPVQILTLSFAESVATGQPNYLLKSTNGNTNKRPRVTNGFMTPEFHYYCNLPSAYIVS